jgi:hypothetical protein
MTNQEILQALSGIECALYYRKDGSDDAEGVSWEDLKKIHTKIDELLHLWHNITGETLSD